MTAEFDYDSWEAKLLALEIANEVGKGILKELSKEPKTATRLSESLGIPLPTVLYHLSRLESAGVIQSRRALGKRLREVKVYTVPSAQIVIRIGGEDNEREGERETGAGA
jgi:predicted transcriptional regulator